MMPNMTYGQMLAQIQWLEDKLAALHDLIIAANTALMEAEATYNDAVANNLPDLSDVEALVTERQAELNQLNSEYLQYTNTRDILMHNISVMRYGEQKKAPVATAVAAAAAEAKSVPAPEKTNLLVVAIVAILVFGIAVIAFKTQRNG